MLGNLIDFLENGKADKVSVTKSITELKLLNHRLNRQVRELEKKAKRAKKKARQLREKGNTKGSKVQAKGYLQFQKFANSIEAFRMNMEALLFKLEQSRSMNDFSGIVQEVATTLGGIKEQVKTPDLMKALTSINVDIESLNVAQELVQDQMGDIVGMDEEEVTDKDVDAVLEEIDSEIATQTAGDLPMAGFDEITEMEKEINRLKNQDK